MFLNNRGINVVISTSGFNKNVREWNRNNLKKYYEIYIESDFKKNQIYSKKPFLKNKKNLWGYDLKPQIPKTSDLVILNNFDIYSNAFALFRDTDQSLGSSFNFIKSTEDYFNIDKNRDVHFLEKSNNYFVTNEMTQNKFFDINKHKNIEKNLIFDSKLKNMFLELNIMSNKIIKQIAIIKPDLSVPCSANL